MRKRWTVPPSSIFLICFLLSGCFIATEYTGPEQVEGYRPVYGSQDQKDITFKSPRQVKNPGKIYTYKNFLLVNEIKEGIHVYDNSDPEQTNNVGFIEILGNSDMAVKDNVLYADHMGNIVALDIENFGSINKVESLPLQNWDLGIPPPPGFHFECVDQTKGIVLRWSKVELINPACYAIN